MKEPQLLDRIVEIVVLKNMLKKNMKRESLGKNGLVKHAVLWILGYSQETMSIPPSLKHTATKLKNGAIPENPLASFSN